MISPNENIISKNLDSICKLYYNSKDCSVNLIRLIFYSNFDENSEIEYLNGKKNLSEQKNKKVFLYINKNQFSYKI